MDQKTMEGQTWVAGKNCMEMEQRVRGFEQNSESCVGKAVHEVGCYYYY